MGDRHVWLVRHGQQGTTRDPELTDRGRRQAEAVAERLRGEPVTRLLVSPMQRARQTAAPIAAAFPDAVLTVDDRARERMEFDPEDASSSWPEFRAEWDRCTVDRARAPFVGDSSAVAAERLHAAVLDALPDTGDLVVVAHSGVISDLVRDLATEEELDGRRPQEKGVLRHGSVSVLRVADVDGAPALAVERIGESAHLPA